MKPTFIVTLVFLAAASLAAGDKNPSTYRIPLPPKPDFSSVEWMIGNWSGRMDRHSPQGEIHLSVSYDLDHRVMVFRESVSLAASAESPANNQSSIGILSRAPAGDSFLLQIFASTGFVNQYRVTVAGPEIDFTPDGGSQTPSGWLSRRIIQRGDVDGFTETVQMAPPLKPFFDYYTAAFTRETMPQKSGTSHAGDHKEP
ncbi:MAG: hypothetical protein EPN47_13290 [Acidobacteria bacterium]|nr:MAG: hypothetical protein EPN47_13290 [Acidobacteriota bacterium]